MNALAPINRDEYDTMHQTARTLALSGYFDAKGDNPMAIAQLATKILAGREIGFGPFASANGIYIIQGRPAIGAGLMASAVKGSGRYNYRVREMSATVCRIEYFERMGDKWESIGISEFTIDDARKAGTKNLDKFARNMLFARAMSNGVRWYCPDVFSGNAVYVPEELGADVDGYGNVIETTGHVVTESAAATPVVSRPAAQTGRNGDLRAAADIAEAELERMVDEVVANPFDDAQPEAETAQPARLSAKTLKRLHALGTEVYGGAWDDKRPALVQGVTKGAATSASDLTEDEAAKLIDGMNRKRALAA